MAKAARLERVVAVRLTQAQFDWLEAQGGTPGQVVRDLIDAARIEELVAFDDIPGGSKARLLGERPRGVESPSSPTLSGPSPALFGCPTGTHRREPTMPDYSDSNPDPGRPATGVDPAHPNVSPAPDVERADDADVEVEKPKRPRRSTKR